MANQETAGSAAATKLNETQTPVIICPYLYENEAVKVSAAFGIHEPRGGKLPFFLWQDKQRIGPERAFQHCWKLFPNRDIIIIHPDMAPMPDDLDNLWYFRLLHHAAELADAGIIACDLLYPNRTPSGDYIVQCAGGIVTPEGQISHVHGMPLGCNPASSHPRVVEWATFGGVYIRRTAIDRCGDLDARYEWAYVADVDYCFEIRKRGMKIYQVPVNLIHEENGTTREFLADDLYQDKMARNFNLFYEKWRGTDFLSTLSGPSVPALGTPEPDAKTMPEIASADDIRSLYLELLGRPARDDEAAAWVGPWRNAYYSIKDSPEGQFCRHKRLDALHQVGLLAAQLRSQGEQIENFLAQIVSQRDQVVQLRHQLDALSSREGGHLSDRTHGAQQTHDASGARERFSLHDFGTVAPSGTTRAEITAAEDRKAAGIGRGRRFSEGTRPVIRWIKGNGVDDPVTRAAIGQATRLFGSEVDYCLCTQGIDPSRARSILEWATQPVEWWPISEHDNPQLSQILRSAGCPPAKFGYWWKWFPERVRPDAPEWVLDGDMVITGKPAWFKAWVMGEDPVRATQDDREVHDLMYGRYAALVDRKLKLYSGLISLSPGLRFMKQLSEVLADQPLNTGHDGKMDMCEQGVIAATFQRLGALPIPLYEFPFGRAFEDHIDYGLQGDQGSAWGFHFGHAFRRNNPHFERLSAEGVIYSKAESGSLVDKFRWLGGLGQWGVPGWSMADGCARIVTERAAAFAGKPVLEFGTSRGRTAAMLAALGCMVTTIDHIERGAATNLAGLAVEVILADVVHYLSTTPRSFDLAVCDVHGNSPKDWRAYAEVLLKCLNPGATLILNNAALGDLPEWREETGVRWFLDQLPLDWKVELFPETPPGVAIVTRP